MTSLIKQALEIVDSALELPPDLRSSYLDSVCKDAALRKSVEDLLQAYEESDGFLNDPVLPAHARVLEADGWLGRGIGPYRLIEKIGEGGMGLVFRARRDDHQFHKDVAIKLLKGGLDSHSTLLRFRAERQILATLDHPNIATLLDGGATAEGLPYFVMELVNGLPINEYCDARKLTILQRLDLFLPVCAAVQYAHERSVIHRDLKPGNVLVTKEGIPKLLDFGIAKILNPGIFPDAPVETTRTMMRVLTLEYASPEQVRGQPMGPHSDVYSLGVILYLLLTGHSPYILHGRSPHQIATAICDEDPVPPSRAVNRLEEIAKPDGSSELLTPEQISSTRHIGIEKLKRRLAGDLDNIVLQALRKEPQRRYASALELSQDIRRHIGNLPVVARKDTAWYRFAKFARRNSSLTGSALLLAMTAMIILASWFWLRQKGSHAPRQIHTVSMRPSIAVIGPRNLSGLGQSAWISTAFSEMLNTELAAGEKFRIVSGEDVARAKSDLGLEEVETYAPDTLERIHTNLDADYVVLGSFLEDRARPDPAVRLDLRLQDTAAGRTLAAVSVSGNEARLAALASQAAGQLRAALGIETVTAREETAVQAAITADPQAYRWYAQGLARLRVFDMRGARTLLERAIAADPKYALGHAALATALWRSGYENKAKEEAGRAFELSSGLSRENHLAVEAGYREMTRDWPKPIDLYKALFNFFPDNLDYGLHLAEVQTRASNEQGAINTLNALRKLPSPAGADPRIDLAEADAGKSFSDFHRMETAVAKANDKGHRLGETMIVARATLAQAVLLRNTGDPKGSVLRAKEAEAVFLQAGDQGGAASALNTIGNVLSDQGDRSGARPAYEQAIQIYRAIGDPAGWGGALDNLAILLSDDGDITRANQLYGEALRLAEEIGDQGEIAETLLNMANNLYIQGDLEKAIKLYRRALSIAKPNHLNHPAAAAQNDLGEILTEQGKLNDAKQSFEEALRLHRAAGEEGAILYPLEGLGDLLAVSGNLAGATDRLEEALEVMRKTGHTEAESWILADLAYVDDQKGDISAARSRVEKAIQIDTSAGFKEHLSRVRVQLAELDLEQGRLAEAKALADQALTELEADRMQLDQLGAYRVRALILWKLGQPLNARSDMERATKLSRTSQNQLERTSLAIAAARIESASGRVDEAISGLTPVAAACGRYGFVIRQLEANLALGEIELKRGQPSSGRERLERLQRDAAGKGLALLAAKAESVLHPAPLRINELPY